MEVIFIYNVIIVDDEEEIRNGLIKKVNWAELGFKIIADAENGQDAIYKIDKLKPDLVFTDIKMPFLDGLELIKYIYENYYDTKVVFISGFNEFEYVKEAMDYNAFGYLLKPIDSKELEDILIKIRDYLDEEYNKKRNLEILKKHYVESLPVLKSQFFMKAFTGNISIDYWQQKCKALNINLDNEHFLVVNISYNLQNANEFIKDDELLPFSIKNIFDEKMQEIENVVKFVSFLRLEGITAIFSFQNKKIIDYLIKKLNSVCDIYYKIMGIKICIGVGYIVDTVLELKKSYESSNEALLYKVFLGEGKTIFINDIEPDENIKLVFSEEDEKNLLYILKMGENEDIRNFTKKIFLDVNKGVVDFNNYKLYFTEILLSVLKIIKLYDIDIKDIFETQFDINNEIDKLYTLEIVENYFLDKFFVISNAIKNKRINSTNLMVNKAKEYIDENYSNPDLSINNICDVLHISPTYFSAIFKKTLNKSFIKYLTELRLEKAIELLNTTSDKTYIIADKVGYTDANYFSYVFKKKYGVSPLKYRNNKE